MFRFQQKTSKIFKREMVREMLNASTNTLEALKKFQEAKLKITNLLIDMSKDEELKDDICNSLESIFVKIESECETLFLKHEDKYKEKVEEIAEDFEKVA